MKNGKGMTKRKSHWVPAFAGMTNHKIIRAKMSAKTEQNAEQNYGTLIHTIQEVIQNEPNI